MSNDWWLPCESVAVNLMLGECAVPESSTVSSQWDRMLFSWKMIASCRSFTWRMKKFSSVTIFCQALKQKKWINHKLFVSCFVLSDIIYHVVWVTVFLKVSQALWTLLQNIRFPWTCLSYVCTNISWVNCGLSGAMGTYFKVWKCYRNSQSLLAFC
jgi:hypothetical protein